MDALAGIGLLDFADASFVNIALPDTRNTLTFSVQDMQWVRSGFPPGARPAQGAPSPRCSAKTVRLGLLPASCSDRPTDG